MEKGVKRGMNMQYSDKYGINADYYGEIESLAYGKGGCLRVNCVTKLGNNGKGYFASGKITCLDEIWMRLFFIFSFFHFFIIFPFFFFLQLLIHIINVTEEVELSVSILELVN